MKRRISFRQYRAIDLTFMLVILAACQYGIHAAASVLYPEQLYVVSPVAALVTLVLMRWSGFAAIHAALGGVIFAALSGGTWEHFVIYGAGNLLCMSALALLTALGKERVRGSAFLSLTLAFCVQLLMQLGRAGLAAALGYSGDACLGFITTDFLSELFTLFVIWIVRRTDGLFEDQKHYLLRVQSEEQAEGRGRF